MATTKIWPVKGWLGKVVEYVENPDKTTGAAPDIQQDAAASLNTVLTYATRADKTQTDNHIFVSGIHCFPETAREEMQNVKIQYGKTGGVVAHHGYQSFAPGEVTPELAHQLGIQLAEELWGDRFQVVVATHLDKAHHIHNHFLINSVSFADGKMFRDNIHAYKEMRACSDRLCRENALSVIPNPQWGKAKQYGEWRAEREGRPTWRSLVKTDVDEAIRAAYTEQDFFKVLRAKGYEIKTGKNISVRPPGAKRFIRLARNFGEAYTMDGIRDQILSHDYHPMSVRKKKGAVSYYPQTNPFKMKQSGGFQGLYLHYCFLLGVFPEKPPTQGQKHFLLREDILKMEQYAAEAQLLGDNNIDTLAELVAFRASLQAQMQALTKERQSLRYRLRSMKDPAEQQAARQTVADLTAQLARLRKDASSCDSIETRSKEMAERLKIIEDAEQPNQEKKELIHDEHRR